MRREEIDDARGAGAVQLDHHVDQHDRAGAAGMLACRDQGRHAAQRGTDQHRRRRERGRHRERVGGEGVERVVLARIPVAVAVAACVIGQRGPAVRGEARAGAPPRVARLAAAVEQHDGTARVGRLPAVSDQPHSRARAYEPLRAG